VFFGTQDFAPPEQYGYAQTDCRADLFSLGVMMGYLLTGQTDLTRQHLRSQILPAKNQ
jgi:serine/threonine protein kinase